MRDAEEDERRIGESGGEEDTYVFGVELLDLVALVGKGLGIGCQARIDVEQLLSAPLRRLLDPVRSACMREGKYY